MRRSIKVSQDPFPSRKAGTYEICQVNMPLRVQQNIIWFDIAMNDALRMDIFERAAQLCNPKSNSILRKAFPRDMEPQVTTIHQIHHNVSSIISMRLERGWESGTHMYSIS